MKNIKQILRNITILYYIFLALLLLQLVLEFIPDFLEGFSYGSQNADKQSTLFTVIAFPITIVFIWSTVLMVRLLISVGKSIYRRNIFNPKTVKLINRYAIIYGALLALTFVGMSTYRGPETDMIETYYEIVSRAMQVILIVMFGQVLNIGCILKQEQELTI